MAQRLSIITLDEDERDTLKSAVDGRPLENVLRRLRKTMSAELDAVTQLMEARGITLEMVQAARSALQTRLTTLQGLPAVDDDVREAAETPLQRGIEQCDAIEREQFPDTAAEQEPAPSTEHRTPWPVETGGGHTA